MTSITRSQYRRAIREGVAAAGEAMPPVIRAKLALHAEWDTEFGSGFATEPVACPMGRLGLCEGGFVARFVRRFDDVWLDACDGQWNADGCPDTIKVIG